MIYSIAHTLRRQRIKWMSWEYWPMWMVYLPVGVYYLYLACRAKSLLFFSGANPSIENGGMLLERKSNIFELIPSAYYPNTLLIENHFGWEEIEKRISEANIIFPCIIKPDIGERGMGVKKVRNMDDIKHYFEHSRIPALIQNFCDFPIELGIFYYRHPASERGEITSVTLKKPLFVIGDGMSTIRQLILKNDRAFLQYEKLKNNPLVDWDKVVGYGEESTIVPYGNHILGATFINYNEIIDEALVEQIDKISQQIKGFYFGRYDLKCSSVEDLKQGKNFSIVELNGSGAEPAHIYDPHFSYFEAQRVLAKSFKLMFEAAEFNKSQGFNYLTMKAFLKIWKAKKEYHKQLHWS